MKWTFDNDRPIYIQLVEQLKLFIISGILTPGQRLASVRELAMEAKVNPNTMQKALSELEDLKLIYTKRTSGKFVTEDDKLISKYKKALALEKANGYLQDMQKIGFNQTEAINFLKEDRKWNYWSVRM